MNLQRMLNEVTVIASRLAFLLDEDGQRAIVTAQADLREQVARRTLRPEEIDKEGREARKRRKRVARMADKPWTLEIPAGTPLRFRPTELSGEVRHEVVVDLYCQLSEPREGRPTSWHNIVLLVWTK